MEEASRFVSVKVDGTSDDDEVLAKTLYQRFGVQGLPTVAFVSSRGEMLNDPRITGYLASCQPSSGPVEFVVLSDAKLIDSQGRVVRETGELTMCPNGMNCGDYPDGCGGVINCGMCQNGETCGGGGARSGVGGGFPTASCITASWPHTTRPQIV